MPFNYEREMKSNSQARGKVKKSSSPGWLSKIYLLIYNASMFIMFTKVQTTVVSELYMNSMNEKVTRDIAYLVKILTYVQLMESIHPIFNLVPGGPFMPFMQVIGRLLVNFVLTQPEIITESGPYADYLFVVWSSIEIFRYSYYCTKLLGLEFYPLTWCRYSLFVPLYPMGGLCESMVMLSAARYIDDTGNYSLDLPNSVNMSISLSTTIRMYIFLMLIPSIITLMVYMSSQRSKQLRSSSK